MNSNRKLAVSICMVLILVLVLPAIMTKNIIDIAYSLLSLLTFYKIKAT
jgi:hypothetical protein